MCEILEQTLGAEKDEDSHPLKISLRRSVIGSFSPERRKVREISPKTQWPNGRVSFQTKYSDRQTLFRIIHTYQTFTKDKKWRANSNFRRRLYFL